MKRWHILALSFLFLGLLALIPTYVQAEGGAHPRRTRTPHPTQTAHPTFTPRATRTRTPHPTRTPRRTARRMASMISV